MPDPGSPFAGIIAARRPGRWLRFRADIVCLAYMALASGLLAWHATLDGISWWLVAVHAAMAYGCGCIQHVHAHTPMWRRRDLNTATSLWIALLRGDGPWSWVPTHVANHHRYANQPGDMTLTTRYGDGNHLYGWLAYTADGCVRYVVAGGRHLMAGLRGPRRRWSPAIQVAGVAMLYAVALGWDPIRAAAMLAIPHGFALIAMVATGYPQHHHTDTGSAWSHSRDFTGRLNNWLHFNHGFHTVHHVEPSLHWTEWPIAHRLVADLLDPRLNEPCLPCYLVRTYLLAPLVPQWRSRPITQMPGTPA